MPKTPADEKVSWGEVCSKTKFGDGLYQSCRDKLPDFTGFAGGIYDEETEEPDEDFDKTLRRHALPVPPPPRARGARREVEIADEDVDEELSDEDEGLVAGIMHGDLGKYLMLGGAAALLAWWFFFRNQTPQIAVTDSATAAPGSGALPTSSVAQAAPKAA